MLEKIDIHSSVTVTQQIENYVQFGIASGELEAGDQLPTVRELSKRLEINRITVNNCYRDLKVMGLVYARRGLGVFVEKDAQAKCRKTCHEKVIARLHDVVSEAKAAGMTATEIKAIARKCMASDAGPYGEVPKDVLALAKKK